VRLVEGDFDNETVYGDDPLAVAEAFASAGASWIHVVDLDAALTGQPLNREVIAEIAGAVGKRVKIQTGGGVRSEPDADELLGAGVARVVIGTAALEKPGLLARLCDRWPSRVVAGIDHRGGEVRSRGWTEETGVTVKDALEAAADAGAAAVVVTDISKDGRLAGPDLPGLTRLLDGAPLDVIASGGVSGLADIQALARLRSTTGARLAGVIVGKAIYEGRVDVARAVEMLEAAKS
jgi:phosphoribosylformimino-5-aminoimidazole carboxamide ribotide isomerase